MKIQISDFLNFGNMKIFVMFVVGLSVAGLAWVGAQELMDHFALKNKLVEEQMVVLKKSLVSQQVQINTKLLEDRIKDLDRSLTALVKERDQQITDIGKSVAKVKQSVDLINRGSDHTYDGKFKQDFKKIYAKDAEGNQYPIAWAMYLPNNPPEKRWKTGTYPLEVHQRVVLAENEERADSMVEVWIENNQMKETEGNRYPVEVKEVEWIKREKEDKEWFFNPRLSLGAAFASEMYPNLGLSVFSYGRTKTDMDWRILEVGIGQDSDNTYFHFSPAQYNIGHWLPLVDNIFLGGFVGVSSDSDESTLFGVNVDVPL